MKKRFLPLLCAFSVTALAQRAPVYNPQLASIAFELQAERMELNALANPIQRAKIITLPGETDQQRAQRHADAIIRAHDSWVTEWSAQNPMKFSNTAPPMPPDMRQDAIRDSDTQYMADRNQQQRELADSQANELRQKIAQLEARLQQANYRIEQGPPAQQVEQPQTEVPAPDPEQPPMTWSEVKIGMTKDAVSMMMGKPNGEIRNKWLYSRYGILIFSPKGFVESIERKAH